MRYRRPTSSSPTILPRETHLCHSLIQSCLSLVKAMRTHLYCWSLGTENDGGGLQWDLISRCWINYTKSAEFPWDSSNISKPGILYQIPALGVLPWDQLTPKEKGTNFWWTIIIKLSGSYICWIPWIGLVNYLTAICHPLRPVHQHGR